jgi:hypothetical protein
MTAPLYTKIFQSVEENMYNLGYGGKAKRKWFGDIAASASVKIGNIVPVSACLMNFTDNAYPTTHDLAFVAVFRQDQVAGISWPKSMTTQLHAYDQFSQASGFVELYFESPTITAGAVPAAAAIATTKFIHDIVHIFRGQFGVRVRVLWATEGSVPTIATVDGKDQIAETAVTYTEMGTFLPYGRIAAAGELS